MSLPRRLAMVLALAAVLVLQAPLVLADPLDDAVRRVAVQLQCPVCAGQTVADSNSGLASDMREVIRAGLEVGKSEQAVLDEFVVAYGDGILSEPPKRGISLGVWIGPLVALAAGLTVAALAASHWLRARPVTPPMRARVEDAGVAEELLRFRRRAGL